MNRKSAQIVKENGWSQNLLAANEVVGLVMRAYHINEAAARALVMAAGESLTEDDADPELGLCCCGCHGDYTQHSMRAGESGRPSSVIVR